MLRSELRALALALVLAPCAIASAQDAIDQAVHEGVTLREQGRDQDALAVFERAYREHPVPRLQAQIGFAQQALGRWRDAEEQLTAARAHAEDPWIAGHAAVIDEAIATVGQQLGTVELVGGPPGAVVRIDGEERGALPGASRLRVQAGSAILEVSAERYFPLQRELHVRAGQTVREVVGLVERGGVERTGGAGPSGSPASGGGGDGLVIAGIVNLGVAVAAGVVAGVFYALREDAAAYLDSRACDPLPGQRVGDIPACRTAHSDATTYEAVAVGDLIGAGVTLAVGVVLVAIGVATSPSSSAALACFDGHSPLGCRF